MSHKSIKAGFDPFEARENLLQGAVRLLVVFPRGLQRVFNSANGLEQTDVLLSEQFDVGGLFVENPFQLANAIEDGSDLRFQRILEPEDFIRDAAELTIHVARYFFELAVVLNELCIHGSERHLVLVCFSWHRSTFRLVGRLRNSTMSA
jgi:hypothetical protein